MTEQLTKTLNLLEAILFSCPNPISSDKLQSYLDPNLDFEEVMQQLVARYQDRGIVIQKTVRGWIFTTSNQLSDALLTIVPKKKKLTKSTIETLAVIAWHQPITRAEIEKIRGVSLANYILNTLNETGWIAIASRRKVPGRPLEWKTTDAFLNHFNLESVSHLPSSDELNKSGFFQNFLEQTQIGSLDFGKTDHETTSE